MHLIYQTIKANSYVYIYEAYNIKSTLVQCYYFESIMKDIISQIDYNLVSLSSKTHAFEDNMTKYSQIVYLFLSVNVDSALFRR